MERFTKSKTMVFPREIIIGHNATQQIAELCNRIGSGDNVLVVDDKKTKKLSGDEIRKILSKANYNVKEVVVSAPTVNEVNYVINYSSKNNIKLLLGVGGGSVIDVTKLAAYELKKPFVSVPTSAAHDGIASPRASLKHSKGAVSKTAVSPLAVLADTKIIMKAPYKMLASGCADVISNISAVMDWELAHRLKGEEFSTHGAVLARTAAEMLIQNVDDIRPASEESVWLGVKAMIVSGVAMSVAGNTRPASGAEHMFSHMLDHLGPGILLKGRRYKKPLHGEQCGVGAIMMIYLHGGDWELIKRTLKKIGAPTSSEELGVSKKKIIEALIRAHEIRPERYTILGETGLTEDAAKKLAKTTGVI
ncbi:MAG: NAD(P)-dependent glycerol-1-phosphate dehydrogenase [Candidatus Thermoplasmatota archaeon]|nr:NAD(P)-dependent glycerol-1-phosphate dehydrogenase [Candidatus Thermoplasmatota archaeon]